MGNTKKLTLILMIALVMSLLNGLGSGVQTAFAYPGETDTTNQPFSDQPYFHQSEIVAVYDGCFVVDMNSHPDMFEYAVISLDGKVLCDNDNWKKFYDYQEIGDGAFVLGGYRDLDGYDRFVCFDANGQRIASYSSIDGTRASIPQNGNYYVITENSDGSYTSTFYALDGRELVRVNGYARTPITEYGFAVLTVGDDLMAGNNALMDPNGQIVEFTIAEGSSHAGKKVESFKFTRIDKRCTPAQIFLTDGTKISDDYVVIDMENRQLHLDQFILYVYDSYLASNGSILDQYGANVLLDVRSALNDSVRNVVILSEEGPYIGAESSQGLAILDLQGNIVAGPMKDVYLYKGSDWVGKLTANSAGMFIVSMQTTVDNRAVWKHGVMNLQGELLAPAMYDSVICSGSYAVLNGREIINAQGQSVYSLDQ